MKGLDDISYAHRSFKVVASLEQPPENTAHVSPLRNDVGFIIQVAGRGFRGS